MKTQTALILILVTMFIGVIVYGVYFNKYKDEIESLNNENKFYKEILQKRKIDRFGTVFYPNSKGTFKNFELYTLDSGRNWYVIKTIIISGKENILIEGHVDSLYPGMMKTKLTLDSISRESNKNDSLVSQINSKKQSKKRQITGLLAIFLSIIGFALSFIPMLTGYADNPIRRRLAYIGAALFVGGVLLSIILL